MAERLAVLYEQSCEWRLMELTRDLSAADLRLTHPRTGAVGLLDEEGEQFDATELELTDRVENMKECSFRWWLAEDHDVYCRIRSLGGVRAVELGMEGCSQEERGRIGQALLARFLRDQHRSLGLVFDPDGVMEDYCWDDFFISKSTLDWGKIELPFPHALGLRCAELDRSRHLPPGIQVGRAGDLCILSAEPDWQLEAGSTSF